MLKRIFDLFFSISVLIVFSPILLILALWVKLDSHGPIFYRGKRVGKSGRSFYIYKFRSMVINADCLGGVASGDNDFRITRCGRFIRRFKLDELPQFINVLLGDMSIVGPRPQDFHWVEKKYSEIEKRIFDVKPGITDWASIWNSDQDIILNGTTDSEMMYQLIIWPRKCSLQIKYIQEQSFWIDIKIIFYTFIRIIFKKWTPCEIRNYPSFDELRAEVIFQIEQQKNH